MKKNFRNASIFILGVIVTIIISKLSDKIFPANDPVVVKEYTDTIKVVHEYNLPKELSNDSLRRDLEAKVKNLELLNNYEKQINERLKKIDNSSTVVPNLVLTHKYNNYSFKGFTQGSSLSYFSSKCPNLDSEFIDIKIDFFNQEIIDEIAFLRVNIYKYYDKNSKEARSFVLNEFYEIKPSDNLIRINNGLSNGKYEIIYGFMFKAELEEEYPTFHMKKCIVKKI